MIQGGVALAVFAAVKNAGHQRANQHYQHAGSAGEFEGKRVREECHR